MYTSTEHRCAALSQFRERTRMRKELRRRVAGNKSKQKRIVELKSAIKKREREYELVAGMYNTIVYRLKEINEYFVLLEPETYKNDFPMTKMGVWDYRIPPVPPFAGSRITPKFINNYEELLEYLNLDVVIDVYQKLIHFKLKTSMGNYYYQFNRNAMRAIDEQKVREQILELAAHEFAKKLKEMV